MTEMPLSEFLSTVKDGNDWGWETEIEYLRRNHGHRIELLTLDIFSRGIQSPVVIGPDLRCWDGHHRIAVAWGLGLETIPVTYAQKEATK